MSGYVLLRRKFDLKEIWEIVDIDVLDCKDFFINFLDINLVLL